MVIVQRLWLARLVTWLVCSQSSIENRLFSSFCLHARSISVSVSANCCVCCQVRAWRRHACVRCVKRSASTSPICATTPRSSGPSRAPWWLATWPWPRPNRGLWSTPGNWRRRDGSTGLRSSTCWFMSTQTSWVCRRPLPSLTGWSSPGSRTRRLRDTQCTSVIGVVWVEAHFITILQFSFLNGSICYVSLVQYCLLCVECIVPYFTCWWNHRF